MPVPRVKEFQSKLIEFVTLRKAELLENIAREKTLSDALLGESRTAIGALKQTWK